MNVNMVLSPGEGSDEEAWAHWGEMNAEDQESDTDSDESDAWIQDLLEGGTKNSNEIRIEPWRTLLLLDENAVAKAAELAHVLVGSSTNSAVNTGGAAPTTENSGLNSPIMGMSSRRGSKETSTEEDESALMKALIEACDVTKP